MWVFIDDDTCLWVVYSTGSMYYHYGIFSLFVWSHLVSSRLYCALEGLQEVLFLLVPPLVPASESNGKAVLVRLGGVLIPSNE